MQQSIYVFYITELPSDSAYTKSMQKTQIQTANITEHVKKINIHTFL